MNERRNWAPVAWGVGIGGMLLFEAWSVFNTTPGDTLSEAVWEYGQHPIVVLVIGILLGHFFWQKRGR